jgi:hypothetical protein
MQKCNKCRKPIQPGQTVRFVRLGTVEDFDGELEIDNSLGDIEEYVEHGWDCTPPVAAGITPNSGAATSALPKP